MREQIKVYNDSDLKYYDFWIKHSGLYSDGNFKFVEAPLAERKEDCLKRIARYKEGLNPANYKKISGFENIVESKIRKLPKSPDFYDISDYKELLALDTKYLEKLCKEEESTRDINE